MLQYFSWILHFIIISIAIAGPFIFRHRAQLLILMWLYMLMLTMWYLFDGCILNSFDRNDNGPQCEGKQPDAILVCKISDFTGIDMDILNNFILKLFPLVMATIVVYRSV